MRFERISAYPDAILPQRATKGSAGYDFFASSDIVIPANSIELVPTGVKCWIDTGYALLLMVRSSMPRKMGLMLANPPGLVDSDYAHAAPGTAPLYTDEGHILFQLWNYTDKDVEIHCGDRIGQGIFVKYDLTDDDVAEGIRAGGFGSTSLSDVFGAVFNTDSLKQEDLNSFLNGAT